MTHERMVEWLSDLERRLTRLESDVKLIRQWIDRFEGRNKRLAERFEEGLLGVGATRES